MINSSGHNNTYSNDTLYIYIYIMKLRTSDDSDYNADDDKKQ